MANPGGNYPGRQIFVGHTIKDEPAFVYFGSGRSQKSQQRYAAPFDPKENAIRIRPLDRDEEFDPFRHYQAVRINPETGLVVVSNSQAPVDALAEGFAFIDPTERAFSHLPKDLLAAVGPEYDNKKEEKRTPRIVGVIYETDNDIFNATLAVTDRPGRSAQLVAENNVGSGCFRWVPTYNGAVDYISFNLVLLGANLFALHGTSARALADEVYEMSDYVDPKYGELRVWAVAGVHNGKGPGGWDLAVRNR